MHNNEKNLVTTIKYGLRYGVLVLLIPRI